MIEDILLHDRRCPQTAHQYRAPHLPAFRNGTSRMTISTISWCHLLRRTPAVLHIRPALRDVRFQLIVPGSIWKFGFPFAGIVHGPSPTPTLLGLHCLLCGRRPHHQLPVLLSLRRPSIERFPQPLRLVMSSFGALATSSFATTVLTSMSSSSAVYRHLHIHIISGIIAIQHCDSHALIHRTDTVIEALGCR